MTQIKVRSERFFAHLEHQAQIANSISIISIELTSIIKTSMTVSKVAMETLSEMP